MSNEHNPIARLISQLQLKWNSEVTPYSNLKLVRWLILPQQARLYEGFLRLESTAHGSLPDMILVLLTPFESRKRHSRSLIEAWIEAYRKDEEVIKQQQEKHPDFLWNVDAYEQRLSDDAESNNSLLVEMIDEFQKALPEEDRMLTITLFPYSVEDTSDYSKWLQAIIELGLPKYGRLTIFDFEEERHFDGLMKSHSDLAKSLSVPLDLDGAMSKIAQSGDPNNPEVQFRKCMMEMSKSVSKNDLTRLHKWGEKGLEVAQRTGLKNMLASAHLIYAGMLFSFKEFEFIDELLEKSARAAHQGLEAGDDLCKPIIIQIYGYQASSKQLQKKREDATNLFCKQADIALEHGYPQQPLMAWWMAYNAIKKKDEDRYTELVEKAYQFGLEQEKEILKSTPMPFIAADYYNILDDNLHKQECLDIDTFMQELEGKNWRADLEQRRKEMEKKRYSLKNLF